MGSQATDRHGARRVAALVEVAAPLEKKHVNGCPHGCFCWSFCWNLGSSWISFEKRPFRPTARGLQATKAVRLHNFGDLGAKFRFEALVDRVDRGKSGKTGGQTGGKTRLRSGSGWGQWCADAEWRNTNNATKVRHGSLTQYLIRRELLESFVEIAESPNGQQDSSKCWTSQVVCNLRARSIMKPFTVQRKLVHSARRLAEFPVMSFHCLRHLFQVLLITAVASGHDSQKSCARNKGNFMLQMRVLASAGRGPNDMIIRAILLACCRLFPLYKSLYSF